VPRETDVVGCSETIPALTDSALFQGGEPNLDPNLVGTFLHTLPEGGRRYPWPPTIQLHQDNGR
jgi:hypothetical protein